MKGGIRIRGVVKWTELVFTEATDITLDLCECLGDVIDLKHQ